MPGRHRQARRSRPAFDFIDFGVTDAAGVHPQQDFPGSRDRVITSYSIHYTKLYEAVASEGSRFTHHTSIAPTGTISLSLANNASNGIEPSFAHHYSRNVIREGRKSKEKVEVYSYELLAYRELVNADAMPYAQDDAARLPDYFITAEDISPVEHVRNNFV